MIELSLNEAEAELLCRLCVWGKLHVRPNILAASGGKVKVARMIDEITGKLTMAGVPVDLLIRINNETSQSQPNFPEFDK